MATRTKSKPQGNPRSSDQNHVSIGFWMFALFMMAIPIVNVIMVIFWAITGQNASKQNYFKAMLAWFAIFLTLWVTLALAGLAPVGFAWVKSSLQSSGLL